MLHESAFKIVQAELEFAFWAYGQIILQADLFRFKIESDIEAVEKYFLNQGASGRSLFAYSFQELLACMRIAFFGKKNIQ